MGFRHEGKEYFSVHFDQELRVYENRCPHFGVRLEWMPDQFLDSSRMNILCSRHSAQFDIKTGLCHQGPCVGDSLLPVQHQVHNQQLWIKV
ncbi:Rieske (2Fe-2S) protein [Marinomonas rhizomae]|nr:Rieske (2Fe-2S) protein [Marinomonas rhizomae]